MTEIDFLLVLELAHLFFAQRLGLSYFVSRPLLSVTVIFFSKFELEPKKKYFQKKITTGDKKKRELGELGDE